MKNSGECIRNDAALKTRRGDCRVSDDIRIISGAGRERAQVKYEVAGVSLCTQ